MNVALVDLILNLFLEVMNFDDVGPRNYDTNGFSHHQPIDLSLSGDRLIPQQKKIIVAT
jgi:hypothetical protein